MPQTQLVFSIAGLSVTLVGFSGLVAALRRDTTQSTLRAYRLRQIPEMGLISALVALITLPLADVTGDQAQALRIGSAVALVLTVGHVLLLFRRLRTSKLQIRSANWVGASLIDTAIIVVAIMGLLTAKVGVYEWILVLLVARPAVAFVFALTDPMEP